MKKIGIITCHRSYNYGAALQAYGLSKAIRNLNLDVEHIDFVQESVVEEYRIFKKATSLKNIVRNICMLPYVKSEKKRALKFEEFIDDYLPVSKKRFTSEEDLRRYTFDYTHFVCGSDQLWNADLFIDSDAFYLDFVKKGKRIAYAPSLGSCSEIKPSRIPMLKKFDCLSVREESGRTILENTLDINVPVVIDPVFLLDRQQWDLLAGDQIIQGDYIYFYNVGDRFASIQFARAVSRALNMKVVVSQTCGLRAPYPKDWVRQYDSGPKEFLNYIKYARYVIGSSFHLTAFSIIFDKPCLIYNGSSDNRIKYLLQSVDCIKAGVTANEVENVINSIINNNGFENKYSEKSLNLQIIYSYNYLKDALDYAGKENIYYEQ